MEREMRVAGILPFLILLCSGTHVSAEGPEKPAGPLERVYHKLLAAPERGYDFGEARRDLQSLAESEDGNARSLSRYFLALTHFLNGDHEQAYLASIAFCEPEEGEEARPATAVGERTLQVRGTGHLGSMDVLKGIIYDLSECRIPFPVDRGPKKRFFSEDDLVGIFLLVEILKKAELNNVLLRKAQAALQRNAEGSEDEDALDEIEEDGDAVEALFGADETDGQDGANWREVAGRRLRKVRERLTPCAPADFLAAVAILSVQTALLEEDFPELRQLVVSSVSALQLRQIAVALYLHVLEQKGTLPRAWRKLKDAGAVGTWQGSLGPYLGIDMKLDYKNVTARTGPRWELLPYDSVFVHPAAVGYRALRRIYADLGAYELTLKSEDYMKRFDKLDHPKTIVVREKATPEGRRVNCLYLDGSVRLK